MARISALIFGKQNLTANRRLQTRQRPQQGRLSNPIGTAQDQHLACIHLKTDICQHRHTAACAGQVLNLQHSDRQQGHGHAPPL